MTDKRQMVTNVKCKCDESAKKTVNICGIYSSLEKGFEFSRVHLPKKTKLYHNRPGETSIR